MSLVLPVRRVLDDSGIGESGSLKVLVVIIIIIIKTLFYEGNT